MPATSENLIVWGDCDAAGIVYYPKYFYFIDCAFQALLRKAGLDNHILFERFGVRVPIIDANAKFVGPATFEDKLIVDAEIVHWGTKSFHVSYHGSREGTPIFEGTEVRVWARIAADGTISTAAIAPQFKAALSATGGIDM
jgi:4-hydroxybenzoyl-CoA thioesterase